MIPKQYVDTFNSEVWVGILRDNKQFVHCLNPERFRVIEEDNSNPLVKCYLDKGHPAFYSIEKIEIVDIENGNEVTEDRITSLMQPQEMIDFCNDWVSALNQYDEDGFDMFRNNNEPKLMKYKLIEYFKSYEQNIEVYLEQLN